MNEHEILESAEQRILQNRTAEVTLCVVDTSGAAVPNARVEVRQLDHSFRFGSNAFLVESMEDEALQESYHQRFASLLNYATLPFYWGGYERTEGETRQEQLHKMAAWAKSHGIVTKGHPLVWHEVFPGWAHDYPDTDVLARLKARVQRTVSDFRDDVTWWDVVNEAVVSPRFDNAVGRWVAQHGAVECVAQAFEWAHQANPDAVLCYNDFSVGEDTQQLISGLLERGVPVHMLGIQSHMHKATWPLERVWDVCEAFAQFSLPLHWTELTVLSGRPKAEDDNDWHRQHQDWVSTPEGESAQADYVEQFYTLLFSHPAVEAVTWWDFSDLGAWQGAPAGFLRKDMSPKPVYDRLSHMVHNAWHTDAEAQTDEQGNACAHCFHGSYEMQVTLTSGGKLRGEFQVTPKGDTVIGVTVS